MVQIVRVHEVVDKVIVEHESPPVVTEAEQRVIKTTTMQRGKPAGLPSPQSTTKGASSEVKHVLQFALQTASASACSCA